MLLSFSYPPPPPNPPKKEKNQKQPAMLLLPLPLLLLLLQRLATTGGHSSSSSFGTFMPVLWVHLGPNFFLNTFCNHSMDCGRYGGHIVSALSSSHGQSHCVALLGKILYSQNAALYLDAGGLSWALRHATETAVHQLL